MRPHSALQSKRKKVGIIWDLDGTIANTAELARTATNATLLRHGIRNDSPSPVSSEEYTIGAMYTTPRRLAWHATSDPDDPIGLQLGKEFDELYIAMVSPTTVSVFPEMVGVIEKISEDDSIAQGVLSNACGRYVVKTCRDLGFIEKISSCLGADQVPAAKPDPSGLLQCCDQIGVSPEFCMYFGDAKTDGMAAKAAGVTSVYCSWLDSHDAIETSAYFDSVVRTKSELMEILHNFAACGKEKNRRKSKTRSIVWDPAVEDNEHANKMRTDNEYWDGRR